MSWHRLLERQIREHLGGPDALPDACRPLLEVVSRTYEAYEADLGRLERGPRPVADTRPPADSPCPVAHVLVADDNRTNQRVAEQLLRRLGCTVELAANGREALEKVARGRFDLVLMDWSMPELDGLAATRRIRALPLPAGATPVVAVTASTSDSDRAECLAAGMDDHIGKPVRPEELRGLLARFAPPEPFAALPPTPPAAAARPEPPARPSDEAAPGAVAGDTRPGAAAAPTLLDLGRLRSACADCDELVADIVSIFLDDAPTRLGQLEVAVATRDLPAAAFHAHALKGMAANLALDPLRTCCLALEEAGRRGDRVETLTLLPRARELLRGSAAALLAAVPRAARQAGARDAALPG